MKNLLLTLLGITISLSLLAFDVSGIAKDSETGDPLAGVNIILTYTSGGIAASSETQSDGSFLMTGVPDGIYNLELYTYPDPIIINGVYYLPTTMEDPVVVSGANISGLSFMIPPHHPDFTLTGALLDDVTNDTITIQDFQAQAKMQYLVEFFIDYVTENGVYILENLPDWTYEFTLFENDYYEGVTTEITIDPQGPDTVHIDFYLEPKMGATVSGVLLDSLTNQPIMQAGRSIKIQAINSMFTETNEQGEFTFINVPPGTYAGIEVTSQDTDYVNCTGSEIDGFIVPENGLDDVQLFQKPWISIHEVTADATTFEPGETKTITFSVVNDDLSYGAIWGVNLIFPEGVSVVNTNPFYSADNSEVIFDELPDCSTSDIKAWEGWHWVGIPPYASSEGNLEMLNESAWSEVTVEFADSVNMEEAPVFYEIYYAIHCNTIQPFSYGTIMMENENLVTEIPETNSDAGQIIISPNPGSNWIQVHVTPAEARQGVMKIFNLAGELVRSTRLATDGEESAPIQLDVSSLNEGIYFLSFTGKNSHLTEKMVISR